MNMWGGDHGDWFSQEIEVRVYISDTGATRDGWQGYPAAEGNEEEEKTGRERDI